MASFLYTIAPVSPKRRSCWLRMRRFDALLRKSDRPVKSIGRWQLTGSRQRGRTDAPGTAPEPPTHPLTAPDSAPTPGGRQDNPSAGHPPALTHVTPRKLTAHIKSILLTLLKRVLFALRHELFDAPNIATLGNIV